MTKGTRMRGLGCTAGVGQRARKWAAVMAASLPVLAHAQAGPGGPNGAVLQAMALREVADSMGLPAQEKAKVADDLRKAQQDLRQARQDVQDASPDDRAQKRRDLQKIAADAKGKVESELTPAEQATFAQKLATLMVKRAAGAVNAERKAATDLSAAADTQKQLADLFDDTTKALAGYATDAEAVKDDATGDAVTKKATQELVDLQRQLLQVLGREDTRTVVAAGMRAVRSDGEGAGASANRRRRTAASQPSAN